MKIEVNGNNYNIEIIGGKARVNGNEMDVKLNEDEIRIGEDIFHLDNKWNDLRSLKGTRR